jgi:predicted PurR-regulated permease PerM
VFLYLIKSILLPFVLGILIAYFLDPAADKLQKSGLSRGLSATVIIISFFILFIIVMLLISPIVIGQFVSLLESLPGYMAMFDQKVRPALEQWLGSLPMVDVDSVKNAMTNVSGFAVKMLGDFIGGLFQSGVAFVNILSLILITPIVAFYLLQDWDHIVARVEKLLPRAHADTIRGQLVIIDQTLAGFVRGQINVCLLLCLFYCIMLSAFDLKFSIIVGVITGFLVIVPYVGWTLASIIGCGIAIFQFDDIAHVWMIFGVFLAGQVLESYFLTPKLVGEKVGLHPVWIIFGMLCGATLFGFVGVLLAVPVTAIIGVLIRFALSRYLLSSYYTGDRV